MFQTRLSDLHPKDIFIWHKQDGTINHASFHLGKGWFFNKNGQSFFNAWQIVNREDLLKNWGEENISVFRYYA